MQLLVLRDGPVEQLTKSGRLLHNRVICDSGPRRDNDISGRKKAIVGVILLLDELQIHHCIFARIH